MKSEVFNGQRFWSYFKYDFTQMWRNHVKAAIGIGLSGLILYVITIGFNLVFGGGWNGPGLGLRLAVLILAFAALELYQTRTYGYLTDKRKGSAWLMNPASTFEKWLSMIIMTVIVLPCLFIGVYMAADLVVAALDPTVGDSIIHSIGNGFRELADKFVQVNGEYNTNWNHWAFAPSGLVNICSNFLFFLLCGLVFKKNKILGGFVIVFIFSSLFSVIMSVFQFPYYNIEVNDFAEAEGIIRQILNVSTWLGALLSVALAGGIYWRLKTLKH